MYEQHRRRVLDEQCAARLLLDEVVEPPNHDARAARRRRWARSAESAGRWRRRAFVMRRRRRAGGSGLVWKRAGRVRGLLCVRRRDPSLGVHAAVILEWVLAQALCARMAISWIVARVVRRAWVLIASAQREHWHEVLELGKDAAAAEARERPAAVIQRAEADFMLDQNCE